MADTKVNEFKGKCKMFPILVAILKKANMNVRHDKQITYL